MLVREYAVAVFVAHEGAVLLHFHRKLGRWLPPGGHVEPNELPDEAARRETLEETGIIVDLIDASNPLFIDVPRPVGVPPRLVQPIGIQLEAIPARGTNPDHEHIDLVYAARVAPGSMADPRADGGSGGSAGLVQTGRVGDSWVVCRSDCMGKGGACVG
ncbi:MAG: NUDIX domain-containing protein [Chloroflexi bacterium]|nr:MAG: NUDIX domain-containing protein [Chloroflexota bacterium]